MLTRFARLRLVTSRFSLLSEFFIQLMPSTPLYWITGDKKISFFIYVKFIQSIWAFSEINKNKVIRPKSRASADRWTDGQQTDKWTDGRTDGQTKNWLIEVYE